MSSIKASIQDYFLKRKLEKAIKNNKTQRHSVPYASAKHIGIYFNAGSAQYSKNINEFVKGLKQEGKKVEVMTYLNTSQDSPYDFPYQVLKDEDISLFGEIKAEKISQFISTPFDYLFCICSDLHLPIRYVMAASNAKCRVGLYAKENELLFDFMVAGKNDSNLKEFINDVLLYTSHITKELV